MVTRDIRTSGEQVECDVCGRTLLRGEHTETYLDGGARREVCDLCSARATQEGWVREGARLDVSPTDSAERRRSLLGRLRQRRERATNERDEQSPPENGSAPARAVRASAPQVPVPPREPRQVHAVPTSSEQKLAAALELFNASEHPRTVAGVARSLGAPVVVAREADERPSRITIVVSWELSWYRYEVELSDDNPQVRSVDKGYELEELAAADQVANAIADEQGELELASA
ncbi:MAG: hypothetical protein ACR2K9_07360 [Solirubrobacteraceae bacterium]